MTGGPEDEEGTTNATSFQAACIEWNNIGGGPATRIDKRPRPPGGVAPVVWDQLIPAALLITNGVVIHDE
ncbi:hypothetical protein Y032_0517g2810 [Ancylostoma ceylanicum]|uniref:Uncharacterized protein n=1 Tax=Ancylostoma ceylanicum TaxID=53326 RepID=A0A016WT66_9BILA|nr:hypothetical protein Y032_0517g2810 [Ancylostoma ceylanicum]